MGHPQELRRETTQTKDELYYLEYETSTGERVLLSFADEDDRDGCHISLDMYKSNLGPVDDEVLGRILGKFHGEIVTASL
ncbi:hypothetical protein JI721_07485 [Alicyclobacillus cycloheptanicus]|uniref:DUF2283 domain-containing protein n=1 Tax=Alicyclobacillus cycloheptanicus TaxID=1457 RepID=A0ABT9XIL7_9BACL|nr:hypothetical protein [Alicyclobacillus cycloheptanicus]MDQ0190146.1 hypothetical protein [Alicyclobacillus cycloheptanicus]WDM02599.1 hypothetical protein JI721_07485 [Alicyclobacillus cycloheptanicus]